MQVKPTRTHTVTQTPAQTPPALKNGAPVALQP